MMRAVVRLAVPFLATLAGAAAVSLHLGCGASAPAGPATVRGVVTFQGNPVAGGVVLFTPDPDRGGAGKPVRADTGPDGTFALPANVPPGWYRVALAPAPALSPPPGPAFPPRLARPDRSGLVREVVAGKDHVFLFAVEVPAG